MFSSDQPLLANALPISIDFHEEDDLIENISLLYKRIANSVNTKEGALYVPLETATFQQYFTPGEPQRFRPTYRKVIDFGPLPAAGVKSVAHGIAFNSECTMTCMYACATDPVALAYINIPFVSTVAINFQISMQVTATTVDIAVGSNRSNFTRCTVVLEYIKNL